MSNSRRDWSAATEAQVATGHIFVLLETLHAAGCFIAISLSFVVYGVLQERMMTAGFGENEERFTWSLFIVFCNRLLTCGVSLGLQLIQRGSVRPVAPIMSYAAVSFGNLVASTCQYDSLKYITFAMQTLAKCCKMLPVMLWGFLIGNQRYTATEMATASAVMAGCAAFIFSGNILNTTLNEEDKSQFYIIGVFLLLVYLLFDGFTSTWQDRLFEGFDMDTGNQVLYTTLCSTVLSFVVLICSSEMVEAAAFLRRNPDAWVYITAVSSVATIIQYFVSYTIKVYGALNFATLMTARQFLSIIASCIIFNHHFTAGQWLGTLVVFSALALRMTEKQCAHMEREKISRKGVSGDSSPASADTPRRATIPALAAPDSGSLHSVVEELLSPKAVASARRPRVDEPSPVASHPGRPPRASAPGHLGDDQEPLLL